MLITFCKHLFRAQYYELARHSWVPRRAHFSSCYRDSVVNAGGRYVGGTAGVGNNGHLSVASAASIDSEARRFSIDSGDVRADFYRDG